MRVIMKAVLTLMGLAIIIPGFGLTEVRIKKIIDFDWYFHSEDMTNGDILDVSPHKTLWRKAFMGNALLLLRATDCPGNIRITAEVKNLRPATVSVLVK